MKIKITVRSLIALVLAVGIAGTTITAADAAKSASGEHPKISKKEAKKIALAKVPGGKIKEGELENEKGKLIWSFDIRAPGTRDITEVQVDAMTGDVVSVENETPADEKKEKAGKK